MVVQATCSALAETYATLQSPTDAAYLLEIYLSETSTAPATVPEALAKFQAQAYGTNSTRCRPFELRFFFMG